MWKTSFILIVNMVSLMKTWRREKSKIEVGEEITSPYHIKGKRIINGRV